MLKNVTIYQPSSLIIPNGMAVRRVNARPNEFIYENYAEDYAKKYDNTTIFYDVFKTGNKIYLIGPPLLNLSSVLQECYAFDKNGQATRVEIKSKPLERTQLSWIDISKDTPEFERLRFDFSVFDSALSEKDERFIYVNIGKDFNDVLNDAKALMTLQLDNKLEWISDWAVYYQSIHGVDTVVLYDNSSTSYSVQDIVDSLRDVPGLVNIIVVEWNFKYGPQGMPWSGPNTPWDSDFCQIGALQHMRFRFSLKSKGFINTDIDELIIPLCGIDIFEALEDSDAGVIGIEGNTIEGHISNSVKLDDIPRFYHFWEIKEVKRGGTIKWAGTPKKWNDDKIQTTAHWVRNIKYDLDIRFSIGHFNRINNGWKVKSRAEEKVKIDFPLRVDFALVSALKRAFPNYISNETVADILCNAENRIQAIDANSINFQNALQSGIILTTEKMIPWNKKWIWRGNVLVFEVITSCNQVAFDVFNFNDSIQIQLSARDVKDFNRLADILSKKGSTISILSNKQGFVIAKKSKKDFKSFEDVARYCSEQILDHYEAIKKNPKKLWVDMLKGSN